MIFNSLHCEEASSYKEQAASFIRLFEESPLGKWDEKNREQSQRIVHDIQKRSKHIFVCVAGGSSAPTKVFKNLFSKEETFPFLLNSVTEDRLDFLQSLDREIWDQSHWLFISKSGKTAESLFYAQTLQELGLKKKISLKGRITCLTGDPSSPLIKRLKIGEDEIFKLNSSLPGRFSFFTLSGLVQGGLLGLNPLDLSEGLRHSSDFYSISTDILAHLMLQFKTGRRTGFFPYAQPSLKELSLWWGRSWSESLFKGESAVPIPSLKVCSLSEIYHGYLEELLCTSSKGWIWFLDLESLKKDIKEWNMRQSKTFQNILKGESCPLLSLSLENLTPYEVSSLITVLLQVIDGLGKWLQVDVYGQPFVDQYKREFLLSELEE